MARRVAIIGFSFRLPGTDSKRCWQDLLDGRDLVTSVHTDRWAQDTFLHPDRKHPGTSTTFAAGSLGDISLFDAAFFSIPPRKAAAMDPQQRLLLEMSWEALENAGIKPSSLRGSSCGVFIGISHTEYSYRVATDLPAVDSSTVTGNTNSIAANRLSYFFDLQGPSMAIDTACSSSLIAFHQACRSILSGESDQALTGAVNLHLHPMGFLAFSKTSMLSKQGRCRSFDASADGYVRAEGGGIFFLKEYTQALKDGDPILAIVANSGVNTDGKKSGLTVPSAKVQADLLNQVYAQAAIDPAAIDYLEAHGTGTPVGDPIEAQAISQALGTCRSKNNPLPIGSIKSNLGHLETASGVAGLVKALYSLQHRVVPPTIGIENPSPHIPLEEWNLQLVTKTHPLKKKGKLIIGVSSFGFGGANAHVILESPEHTPHTTQKEATTCPPLFLSAKDPNALKETARTFSSFLNESRESYTTIAYNALFRREWHPHRLFIQGPDKKTLIQRLLNFANDTPGQSGISLGSPLKGTSQPAFIYSGNGSQWAGMGKQLLEKEPLFRAAVQEVDALFQKHADYSLEEELAGKNGTNRYQLTEIAQPSLFALQVGLTQLLRSRGIHPTAVAGHSVGEIAAAWASGALTLVDAVKVVTYRSRLQGLTKGKGAMTAIGLDREAAQQLLRTLNLTASITLAGINSPKGVVLAGNPCHLQLVESALNARNLFNKRLDLDYAFHSPAMDEIEAEIKNSLAKLKPKKSDIPFYSTVTGTQLEGTQLTIAYWWKNIRQPVQFEPAIKTILNDRINLFIEIGPHAVLRSYLNDCLQDANVEGRIIPTLMRGDDSPERVWAAHHQIAIAGSPIDWEPLFPSPLPFVQLPNYSWQKERHWHPITSEAVDLINRRKVHPLLGYPLSQQELTWENQLDTQLYPNLGDHKVGSAILFPGAGFAELTLAAAIAWEHEKAVTIEELEIRAHLVLHQKQAQNIRLKIEPQDGSFTLKSRRYAQEDPWSLHVVGRILPSPNLLPLQNQSFSLPIRKADFDAISHQQTTLAAGLEYGPAFQCIEEGWIEDHTVLAKLHTPECIQKELPLYHIHPAFLDGAFQLLFQLLKQKEGYVTPFIPTKIERLTFRSNSSKPCFAQATLLRRTPHSAVAEFTLFDQDRQPIVTLSGVRFRKAHLTRKSEDSLYFLDYYATPVPRSSVNNAIPFERMQNAFKKLAAQPELQHSYRCYTEEVDPLLESLAHQFEQELSHQNIPTTQTDGLEISAQQIWNSLLVDYPDYSLLIQAVSRARSNSTRPHEQLLSQLVRHILGPEAKQKIEQVLRQLIIEGLNNLPEGQRIKILEISEGVPPFATAACSSLDFTRSNYCFATPSKTTLEACAGLTEHFSNIQLTSIDTPSKADYQIALITLDFETEERTEQALKYASEALSAGGSLIILGLHPARWIDFIFKAAHTSPQRSLLFRQQQLQQLPFSDPTPLELVPGFLSGPYFLLAKRAESTPVPESILKPRHWIFLTDKNGYEAQFAVSLRKQLEARGDSVTEALPADETTLASLLNTLKANHGKIEDIIHLAGLAPQTTKQDATALLDNQVTRCSITANLVRACGATHTDTTLWLITSGANKALLPPRNQAEIKSSTSSPADAALWGFGRTLLNEASNYTVRLVDLEELLTVENAATALAHELEKPDVEQEIILTKKGARYAPRLRYIKPPVVNIECDPQESLIKLGFDSPGQLRHLRWEAHPNRFPTEEEVEVEVHATGLNFRDVMYALGLLSDEGVENGFAGPTLGMEFSGIVRRVGNKIRSFAPGDRVVGFAPSSFTNRVLTKEGSLTKIPAGLSFESAATIPSTFFTSYYSLHYLARLQPGEKVLIHGAAGGIGLAAIQIARWLGAEVYATAGSDEKRDFLHLLGVKHIFDSRALSFADEILSLTNGKGVDVVLNSLSGEAINCNLKVLKPFGRFLELGKRDFYANTKIGLRPFRNNISYFGIDADQLMQEHPKLTHTLFQEMMELFRKNILHPLPYQAFEADEIVEAFRYMQQARQIGKIVVTYRNGISQVHKPTKRMQKELKLDPNASYLVTGGLKGFGLKTAEWLASKGARHLVLISRSGPSSEEAKPALAKLEAQGVRLLATSCDITDKNSLSSLLETIKKTLPPLKGIVHAAAVIEDSLILNTDKAKITQVLAPKVLGAQYLHEMTAKDPLDFFILFSSATTLFGNPGQSSYVAANSYLEALAHERRQNNLPATCILWGAIDDVGFLARNQKTKESLKGRMGGAFLHSSIALEALESLLVNDRSGLGILEVEERPLRRFLLSAKAAKFSEFFKRTNEGEEEHHESKDIQSLLRELPPEELLRSFTEMVKKEIGQILRLPSEKIEDKRPIYEMGLDSLMAVEVVLALESCFGIRLPAMELNQTTTITKLAERLIQLLQQEETKDISSPHNVHTEAKQLALQHGLANTKVLELIDSYAKT